MGPSWAGRVSRPTHSWRSSTPRPDDSSRYGRPSLEYLFNRHGSRRIAVALFGAWWPVHLLNLVVIVLGLLLMGIVLIQRGKGGGLAGAFGGAGGSSPFGSRAADQFVKITLWLAGVWVLVIMIQVKVVKVDSVDQANKPVIGGRGALEPRG